MADSDDARKPPGTPEVPVSSLDDLRSELKKFRPVDVLARCRNLSIELGQNRSRPLEIEIPPESDKFGLRRIIRVAPYSVALIARLSLVEGSRLAPGQLDETQFRKLLQIVSELDDPSLAPRSLLLRTWDEQAWYQRDIKHAIGRGLMWYREIPKMLLGPEIDLPSAFETQLGLTVDDFFGLAFLLFSIASSPRDTPFQYFTTLRPQGVSERAQELLASDKVKKFLATAAADQAEFRERAAQWNPETGGSGRYDLSPLIERPLVSIEGSGDVAPIPDLLIWMVDEQPYWRLRDAYRGDGDEQPFAAFFGKRIFERYVGELLADRMPGARLLAEEQTEYRPGRFGPDWIVVQGEVGIAIETVLATVRRSTSKDDEWETLRGVVQRDVAPRVSGMPEKIAGLVSGRPDLGLDAVQRWHRLVVTKAALPWISITKPELIDPLIDDEAMPYHIASIEDFETLMAAETNYGVTQLLAEAERDPGSSADLRAFLSQSYQQLEAPLYYGRLNRLQEEFFAQFQRSPSEGDG